MSKSSDYWEERFKQIEESSNAYGQETYRQIEPAFDQAQRQIQGEIEAWYGRFAINNNISMHEARRLLNSKELEELKWDVEEYIKYGRENALNEKWIKELENASCRFHVSRLEALKIRTQQAAEVAFGNELDAIDKMARRVFTEDYYQSIYEIQKGFNIGWDVARIDERKLNTLISKPWAADGKNFSQRIWQQKSQLINELHNQLTRACILGKAPDEAINEIARKFKTTKHQASRLVMTEQAYFHSVAQKEAFNELDVEEYEIVATLDSHTSDICREMDGKHFPMSDYKEGVTAPPFHVFCRSVTVPWFEDNFNGQRAARGEDGKTYYVPDSMTYEEWKNSFVDGGSKDGMSNINRELNLNNIRTADELQLVTQGIKKEISDYANNASKWSGRINIGDSLYMGDANGIKEWNCDITLLNTVGDGTIWHEMLHSCSISYFDEETYIMHRNIEEASVEFLTRQICKKNGVKPTFAYNELTIVLQALNDEFQYGSDMAFAKELFNVPLPERYEWLVDKVDGSLRELNASFEDYNDVMQFVRTLEGGLE